MCLRIIISLIVINFFRKLKNYNTLKSMFMDTSFISRNVFNISAANNRYLCLVNQIYILHILSIYILTQSVKLLY